MPEPLLEDIFPRLLKTRTFGRNHYLLGKIDSTNQFAKRLAVDGAPEGTLVFAEEQTKGRGRWGRHWESHKGKGLQFSVVLRPKHRPSSASLLTLLGAVSTATILESTFDVRFDLQWPNDVVFHGKKIAGVLTETLRNRSDLSYAVLGIGLNVHQVEDDFSPELRDKAASLSMAVRGPINRFQLLADILFRLELDYQSAQESGFRFVLERWVSYSNLIDRKIALNVNGSIQKGWVKGFHTNGDLILISEDGNNRRFSDGHVLEVHHAARD